MIDLPNRTLDLLVDDATLAERRKHLKPFKSKISSGWLRRYTAFAKSANVGGTLMSDGRIRRTESRTSSPRKIRKNLSCYVISQARKAFSGTIIWCAFHLEGSRFLQAYR